MAAWAVRYRGGETLEQWTADGQEVPFKAIRWADVESLTLTGPHVQETMQIVAPPPDSGLMLSLRARTFLNLAGENVMFYLLVLSDAGAEVGPETTRGVLYWSPTGVSHECDLFDCPDVRRFAMRAVHGNVDSLMPRHQHVSFITDAHLTSR